VKNCDRFQYELNAEDASAKSRPSVPALRGQNQCWPRGGSFRTYAALGAVWLAAHAWPALAGSAQDLTLVTLAPGHFHAALFQREMLPGIAEEAFVYAPLGPDLVMHLDRIAQFNLRRDKPTQFLNYVRDPQALPAWEKSNMLAKYYVTTTGIHLARENRTDP